MWCMRDTELTPLATVRPVATAKQAIRKPAVLQELFLLICSSFISHLRKPRQHTHTEAPTGNLISIVPNQLWKVNGISLSPFYSFKITARHSHGRPSYKTTDVETLARIHTYNKNCHRSTSIKSIVKCSLQ